ncbi:sulfate/molybdate ABC transporter ATP-binding protein [Tunicatimonas pelagia]|uniref:sulfate/molybdate ABC transporter ATP-binding protein n=1 Tax=Tunicatimonas pelagia TaxID=931531 RepID=UPI002665FB7A|nr:ABC transporter ATP-binding protein [Tunicatimonas pelagia]WKN42455.1 ABC transporter ATP-binding protein [Tunicatimonas pelagia]
MTVHLQKQLRGSTQPIYLDVSFEIQPGEIIAIMGPSGAGKTSILKMIAGLLLPDQGQITVGNRTWFNSHPRVNLRTQQRSIGYVFQDYALFPNMNVRQNLEYALPADQPPRAIDDILELIHIQNLAGQKPTDLSGGQQQRVALARALLRRPKVLLLDEPFAALDEEMRSKLQQDLMTLHHRYQTITVLVSHTPSEVARLANRAFLLQNGKVVQQGHPSTVLSNTDPATLLEGEVLTVHNGQITLVVKNSLSIIHLPEDSDRYRVGDTLYITADQYHVQRKKEV